MANKIKHNNKQFCRYYLQCFSSSKVLECYFKNCLAINHTKSVLLPEYVDFQNCKRLAK